MSGNVTLDELLDILGFIPIDLIVYQFVVPTMGVIGIIFCTINACIFFRKPFNAPADDYFKLISLIYILDSLLSVPYGFCFSPKYFPEMDRHMCAIVLSVYIPYINLAFHYTGILEIAILLERMKIFSTIVKTKFTVSPKKVCFLAFLLCVVIDGFFAFVFEPISGGDFYYFASDGQIKQNTFYFAGTTEFANSNVGRVLLIVDYVVRDLFTMITSVTLNVVSIIQMRIYFKKKAAQLQLISNGVLNISVKKELKLRKTEKNHLLMVITLCSIEIVSRTILMTCFIYFLFRIDYIAALFGTLVDIVLIFVPMVSFFVFYHFNKKFRKEFHKMVCLAKLKNKSTSNTSNGMTVRI